MDNPRLRPVEVFPVDQDGQHLLVVNDPSRLASGSMAISGPALFILSLLDGRHSLDDISRGFAEQFGRPLPAAELAKMIEQLDSAHYLDSESFAEHFQSLVDAYRSAPARISDGDRGSGDGLVPTIARMLLECRACVTGSNGRRLAGLIAPHLDFGRGTPCYADAYGVLATIPPAKRFVLLGTNHFGRGTSVVATGKDFQTPLGTTRTDRAFLSSLQERLSADLCEHEFDHQQEHSVELQVLILQHLFGAGQFEIVPILCPDPCGPTGTAPRDGQGVDLRLFAETLGQLARDDATPTVIIAGADLSHVGSRFGDQQDLDADFLHRIERSDHEALGNVVAGSGEAFVETLTRRQNNTRVCSAGCIYALMTALPGSQAELLRYHQAVDPSSGTCVTCSAVAFWQ